VREDRGLSRSALAATLRVQDNVISRQQALACGLSRKALAYRIRPDGPWQRLLPGSYVAHTGLPTAEQKDMAALLYAGPGSVLTGPAALRGLRVTAAEPGRRDVLVPSSRRPRSVGFVTIHRTTRMPERVVCEGRRLYTLPARALADTARDMTSLREVRALIAGALQRGDCRLGMLAAELREGQVRDSALLRQVLAEAADGIRSVVEAEFKDLIERARLPRPLFNAQLFAAGGTFIAKPDAWWPDAGVAAEVDSRQWHLRPADWEKTMRRHAMMSRHGILVLHFTPGQIRSDPATVIAVITDALSAGRARPPLRIRAMPAAA
jgi:very-short-patch-repair endonuclease